MNICQIWGASQSSASLNKYSDWHWIIHHLHKCKWNEVKSSYNWNYFYFSVSKLSVNFDRWRASLFSRLCLLEEKQNLLYNFRKNIYDIQKRTELLKPHIVLLLFLYWLHRKFNPECQITCHSTSTMCILDISSKQLHSMCRIRLYRYRAREWQSGLT